MTITKNMQRIARGCLLTCVYLFGVVLAGGSELFEAADPQKSATAEFTAEVTELTVTQGESIQFATSLAITSENTATTHVYTDYVGRDLTGFYELESTNGFGQFIDDTWTLTTSADAPPGSHQLNIDARVTTPSGGWLAADTLRFRVNVLPADDAAPAPSAVAVTAGTQFSLALLEDGTVRAWGANGAGQLGNNGRQTAFGRGIPQYVPVTVSGLTNVRALAAGGSGSFAAGGTSGHALALLDDGTVMAWGNNDSGQLGNLMGSAAFAPVVVQGLNNIVAIAAGSRHSLALRADGQVLAWGANFRGQLGNGTISDSATPQPVQGLNAIVEIAAAGNHSMALASDGTVRTWGTNVFGQIGNGLCCVDENNMEYFADTPFMVPGIIDARGVRTTSSGSIAWLNDGTVFTWGLSIPTSSDALNPPTPRPLLSSPDALGLAEGNHMLLLRGGRIEAWGDNRRGQLGNANGESSIDPVPVAGLNGISEVAAGSTNSLALENRSGCGIVWSWGGNFFGELGDGPQTIGEYRFSSTENSAFRGTPNVVSGIGEQDCSAIVVAVSGAGSVVADVTGMQCDGPLCVGTFVPGQVVNLTAVPGAGGQFTGWGEDCAAGATNASFQLTADRHRNCTALFEAGEPVNQPPTASFTLNPPDALINETVTVDASQSTDADGMIVGYEWDFTDDGIYDTTGSTATTAYTTAGIYTVRLRVTDDDQASSEVANSLFVVEPGAFFDLAIEFQGAGTGTVSVAPSGITLPDPSFCDGNLCVLSNLPANSTYSLTTSTEGANFFFGWTPSQCDSTDVMTNACNVVLTSDRLVVARFESET